MKTAKIRLLRNATLLVELEGKKLLVDPMLAEQGSMPPMPFTSNGIANPTVPLPISEAELQDLINEVDAVFVTHLHPDHWDARAQELLPKSIPVFCQPADRETLLSAVFTRVIPVDGIVDWCGIQITRTSGRHGRGELAEKMGPVAGFVVRTGEICLYIAGDTVWCPQVKEALLLAQPDVVVVNAGAARFDQGEPITMTAEEVVEVARSYPDARIVAVHLEALNHCYLSRESLKQVLAGHHLLEQCAVPADGEELLFTLSQKSKTLNQRIVEQLYRLFGIRDLEGLKLILADDIVWQQMEGFPGGGTYMGQEAVFKGVFNRFSEEWAGWKAIIDDILDAGDTVVVTGHYEGVYKATQRPVFAAFAHHYTLCDGRVTHFRQFTDTALIAAVAATSSASSEPVQAS